MRRCSSSNKTCPSPDRTPPPPSYHDSRKSPLIVAETTTTRTQVVTTTTETTTHFLSFPAWMKRSTMNRSTPQHPHASGGIDGREPRAQAIQRDKALPPTPSDSPAHLPLPPETVDHQIRKASTPQSTSTLARTSVGLGLSNHVLPHAPASTSTGNEINTVAFISSSPTSPSAASFPTVRRSKSSQRLGGPLNPSHQEAETPGNMGRRSRGISLLGFSASEPKGNVKGKDKAVEEFPKPLARKSSFWSRRKAQPAESPKPRPTATHSETAKQSQSLEVNLSEIPPPFPRRQKLQARDPLSRSSSERPQSYHPSLTPDVPTTLAPASPSLPTRRPSTAGGNLTPATDHSQPIPRLSPTSRRAPALSFTEALPAAPVPRTRSQTNPPLLHRLSLNVFSSSPFLSTSPTTSPTSPILSATSEPVRKPVIIPRPMENEETPHAYVTRLMDAVSKVEVTGILASSAEPFYSTALRSFIGRFDFIGNPLDIALRKLLLDTGLPKETQQIDRVMEAFAQRYIQCNPALYSSGDHPYILAFSLIMLHTDAFNKSNRRKMTKPDYIKNASLPGVSPEVLDYFFDNIVFAPFIFIEDPLDFNGQRGLVPEPSRRSTVFRDVPSVTSGLPSSGSTLAIRTNKIDPYYMIINDLLAPLRINVEAYIPLSDPFSYKGTLDKWDEEDLLLAFANAHVVEVGADFTRPSPFFGLAAGGASSPLIPTNPAPNDASGEILTLRVTKVGLMDRKDELGEGGKKPISRKWRPWGMLLTGSQLLFSRDPTWMQSLIHQAEKSDDSHALVSSSAILKVDELVSLRNAVAAYDKSYSKHRFTFRLVLSDGRHLLLRTSSENDMNQWIARINYASAFKTAGVRMRLLGMSGRSMQITGLAAATSHLHDLQNQIHSPPSDSTKWDDNAPQQLFEMLSGDESVNRRPQIQRKVTLKANREEVELEAPMPLGVEKTAEFKDAFDQVRADLAAENWTQLGRDSDVPLSLTIPLPVTSNGNTSPGARPSFEALSQASSSNGHSRLPSRAQIIESKIADLDDRLVTTESHLDTHMQFIRNVATLTPFQKATRERLAAAIQTRTRTVMQLRLDIARMRCHRDVLCDDIVAESRIWKEVKDIALKTAKETLQTRQSPETSQTTLSRQDSSRLESPAMLRLRKRQESESSLCDSFHTAIDFGPEWPSSDDMGFLAASGILDSPRPSTSGSFSSYRNDGNSSRVWKSEPASTAGSHAEYDVTPKGEEANMHHDKFYTAQDSPAEEAEAWDRTRCAKRVSLVRVPSTLDLLPVSKRLTLTLSSTTESKS